MSRSGEDTTSSPLLRRRPITSQTALRKDKNNSRLLSGWSIPPLSVFEGGQRAKYSRSRGQFMYQFSPVISMTSTGASCLWRKGGQQVKILLATLGGVSDICPDVSRTVVRPG